MKYLITILLALVIVQTKASPPDSLSAKLLQQEMIYWNAHTDSVRLCALLIKARLNREAGLYTNALSELNRAQEISANRNEGTEIEYQKMITYFLLSRYDVCAEMAFDSSDIKIHYNEYLIMKLYSLNEMEKWGECKSLLLLHCNKNDTLRANEIEKLPVSYKYKSPQKAKKLSAFLPGLGETYAGYPLKGLISLILNGGFLFFAGYNYYAAYYISGSVLGIFPFLRFYSGGKKLSLILANKHNEKLSDGIKDKYWKVINSTLN
jgi:hypothetical protein